MPHYIWEVNKKKQNKLKLHKQNIVKMVNMF